MRNAFILLATLAMLLLMFASCNDVGSFGADLDDENLFEANFSDNISIASASNRGDSVLTYADNLFNSQFACGHYIDPITGNLKADLYFQVDIPFNNAGQMPSFKDVAEADSIIFRLTYDSTRNIYGPITGPLNFQIYLLNENLDDDIDYYSSFEPEFVPRILGEVDNFFPNFDSTVLSEEPIGDIVGEVPFFPHLAIPMETTFGTSLIKQDTNVLQDRQLFLADNPGFLLRSEQPTSAMLYFLVASGFSGLHVYYKTGEINDKAIFAIRNAGLVVGNTYSSNFENSIAQDVLRGGNDTLILVQGMGSLDGMIDLGDFSELDNSLIANAELYIATELDIPVENHGARLSEEQLDNLDYDPITRLALIDDSDGEVIPDLEAGFLNVEFAYDGRIQADTIMNSWVYRFVVTNYMQDLVNGEASSTLRIRSNTENFEANRSVLLNENSSRPPRLEVVYSPLNR